MRKAKQTFWVLNVSMTYSDKYSVGNPTRTYNTRAIYTDKARALRMKKFHEKEYESIHENRKVIAQVKPITFDVYV